MASSSIVIKVKFGEMLRRFNAIILDEELDLDMVRLKEKIRSLFSFALDVDFTLTYIDEDGDVVTLADEDDLRDVVRQSLDPLRITVKLNADKVGRSNVKSSGSSTPLRSPRDHIPFQTLNSGVSEILKSVPEPLRDVLSKLSLDLASKATSSTPGLADLMEKLKLAYLNQLEVSESQYGLGSSTPSGTTENTMGASEIKDQPESKADGTSDRLTGTKSEASVVVTSSNPSGTPENSAGASDIKDQQGPKIDGFEKLPSTSSEASVVKGNQVSVGAEAGSSNSKNKGVDLLSMKFGVVKEPRSVDLNVPYYDNETSQYLVNTKGVEGSGGGAQVPAGIWKNRGPLVIEKKKYLSTDKKVARADKKKDDSSEWKYVGFGASNPDYLKHCLQDSNSTEMGLNHPWVKPTKATNDSCSSSGWQQGVLSAINECPFAGMPLPSDPVHAYPYAPPVPPFKRSYNHGNGMGTIFHRGVRCDGCGVHPITGPRFKSKVKDDYDLCSICFAAMGNDADYIRIDRPVHPRRPLPFKGFYDPALHMPPPPASPCVLRGPGMKPSRSKLDSRFILDVNVLDGTIMAPSTAFTKIWRMRNNGTIVWPQGTQLLWIGGDRLSNSVSAEVEIPADGLHVEKELDIAVDFTAPELPGRYISYWRMASPSGQKFGQRVWVLIQVDASMKDLGETSINLNLPPVSTGMKDPEVANTKVDQDPLVDNVLHENNFIRDTELENPFADAQPNKDQEMNFPINDTLIIGSGVDSAAVLSTTTTPGVSSSTVTYHAIGDAATPVGSSVSYPTIGASAASYPQSVGFYPAVDFPEVLPAVPSTEQLPSTTVVQASASAPQEASGGDLDREQTLLRELEEMGFKQVDLNKEILRMNEYNLEQSVDDLCGVSEWDPILEELEEMGFSDKEINKKLLKKNNGSIKRVVMDLINGELA